MNERLHTTSRDFFGPRQLLLTTICLHFIGILLTAGWFFIPLVVFAYSQPLRYLPFTLFVLASLALLVYSWGSRRWLPSVMFCVARKGSGEKSEMRFQMRDPSTVGLCP